MKKRLAYGMVGGDTGAFIGGVHRIAVAFGGDAVLTAGAFSRDAAKNRATGEELCLEDSRVYASYEEMAAVEGGRDDGIDFVCIVTPNNTHYDVAKRFLQAGIHVLCEKPLCFTAEQGAELQRLAGEKKLLFGVNYSYTGNVMVKVAKEMIREGKLGDILNVEAQYLQEWLIDELGGASDTAKLSSWRMEPAVAGASNCVGDIGTHIENTVAYITGLKIKRVCARLGRFGYPLDFCGHILLEYENGASGIYTCSQVSIGHQNDLALRIFGTKGMLEWHEEQPDDLIWCEKGGAPQKLTRSAGYLKGPAASWSRIPSGHPEGLYEAFANIYKAFTAAVAAVKAGEAPQGNALDFPTVDDGVDGLRFLEAVLASDAADADWVNL